MKKLLLALLLLPTLACAQTTINGLPTYGSPLSGSEFAAIYLTNCNPSGPIYSTCKIALSAIKTYIGSFTSTIASGTATLATSAIASGTCATVISSTATGVLTTDVVGWSFNASPTSTTGYSPSTNGMLTIISYPTSGNVNFVVCNNSQNSITPGAITLNWRVTR